MDRVVIVPLFPARAARYDAVLGRGGGRRARRRRRRDARSGPGGRGLCGCRRPRPPLCQPMARRRKLPPSLCRPTGSCLGFRGVAGVLAAARGRGRAVAGRPARRPPSPLRDARRQARAAGVAPGRPPQRSAAQRNANSRETVEVSAVQWLQCSGSLCIEGKCSAVAVPWRTGRRKRGPLPGSITATPAGRAGPTPYCPRWSSCKYAPSDSDKSDRHRAGTILTESRGMTMCFPMYFSGSDRIMEN